MYYYSKTCINSKKSITSKKPITSKKQTTFRKTYLATLLIPLFGAYSAQAEQTASVTDGSSITISGIYESSISNPAILVDGEGSTIKAGNDVTIYVNNGDRGGIVVSNGGEIDFTGVTIADKNSKPSDDSIMLINNGTIKLTDSLVNADGSDLTVLLLTNGSQGIIDNTEFNATGDVAHLKRIILVDQSTLTLNNSTLNIASGTSSGATALRLNSGVIKGQGNKITTDASYAIYLNGDNSVLDLKDTEIHVKNSTHGIFVESRKADLNFEGLKFTGDVKNAGVNFAFITHTKATESTTTFKDSSINLTTGDGYYHLAGVLNLDNVETVISNGSGLLMNAGGTANVNNSTFLTSNLAVRSYGILTANNSIFRSIDDGRSNAFNTTVSVSNKATINNSEIYAEGDYSYALAASGQVNLDNVLVKHNGANGAAFVAAGQITGNRVNVQASEDNVHGINVQSRVTTLDLKNSAVDVKGADSSAILINSTRGTEIPDITLDNSSIVSAQSNGLHVLAADADVALTNGTTMASGVDRLIYAQSYGSSHANMNVTADNNVRLNGNIYADTDSVVTLSLANNSIWQGMTTEATTVAVGQTSAWNMTDNSSVKNLAMSNDGQVVFMGTGTPYQRLETVDLTGNGHFVMRTGIVEDLGDRLSVIGSSAGDHKLSVANNGSAATDGTEVLTVVDTTDGVAQFALTNDVELGAYIYKLRKNENGTDWELYATPGGKNPGQTPEPKPNPGPDLSTSADASVNMLNVGYLLNFAENHTLLQRMGQLRTNSQDGNVWIRGYGGQFDSFGSQALKGFTLDYTGTQLGVDKQWEQDFGITYFGAMTGLSNSTQRYSGGRGHTKNYHVGLYGGYLDHDGLYIDGWVKYNQMRNHINVIDTAGKNVTGKGHSHGYAFSLEAGQRFHLSEEKSGVYLEPQAQVTVSRQGKTNFTNSNGLRVGLSNYTSVLGRFGGLVGYDVTDSATPVNFYFKTAYLREFKGDTSYSLNGKKANYSFKGDWWLNGVGTSVEFNKKHNVYIDMEHLSGKRFNQHQLNVGYRFNF